MVEDDPADVWLAKSGFGGTEYLLSGVLSEGTRRGMSYNHMAELLSWNPAQRFGLLSKGDIAPGYDADIEPSASTAADDGAEPVTNFLPASRFVRNLRLLTAFGVMAEKVSPRAGEFASA